MGSSDFATDVVFQLKKNPTAAFVQEHDQAVDPNLLQLAEAYRIAAGKLQGSPAPKDGQDSKAAAAAVAGLDAGGSCSEAAEDMELLADLFGGGAPSAEKGGQSAPLVLSH